mmetsp:Transcript_67804/g.189269  ORF Transcript_67804/g.189269 Transcript_67804/m.189269 type:complete len:318 (+) Transcript_67804:588-1541(+)
MCNGDDALHAVNVGAPGLQQLRDKILHIVEVDIARLRDAHAGHGCVVLMLAVRVQELGLLLQRAFEVKGANVEHTIDRNLRLRAALDGRELVDALQASLDALQVRLRHQVCLVEQHAVGEGYLLDRLVLDALGLLLVEVLLDVLGVDERHNAIEPREGLDLLVDEEGLRNRCRIGQACRLDDDAIEPQNTSPLAHRKLLQHCDQVLSHCAADAAVHHLNDFLVSLHLGVLFDELIVDADLAELILDDCDLLPVRRRQDMVEKRRLATAKEAGNHGHRNAAIVLGHHVALSLWPGVPRGYSWHVRNPICLTQKLPEPE